MISLSNKFESSGLLDSEKILIKLQMDLSTTDEGSHTSEDQVE